jgi:hypothetical protein
MLNIDDTEAQICANTQEESFSITMSWTTINQHRREVELPSVTKSAVIGLLKKNNPQIRKIKTVRQGNRDPNSTRGNSMMVICYPVSYSTEWDTKLKYHNY